LEETDNNLLIDILHEAHWEGLSELGETDKDLSIDILHEAHWEGLSDSEKESDTEISEPEDNISDEGKECFEILLSTAKEE
jgi:hypothetical protein